MSCLRLAWIRAKFQDRRENLKCLFEEQAGHSECGGETLGALVIAFV